MAAPAPTREDDSIHGVGAFVAWAVCGLLWFVVYLTVLSVGGAVLVFAILLTVLLATKALPSAWRLPLWIAFGLWLAWWVLVVAGPARATSDWMVMAGFLFLLSAVASAPGSLGLPLGAGLTAFASGFRLEEGTSLVWAGLATAVAALLGWLWFRRRVSEGSRVATDR